MGCHLSTPDVANHCDPALDRKWRQEANVPKPVVARTELRAVVAGDVAGNGLTTQSAPQPIS